MRILLWHVHAAWATSFVHGRHEYLVPVTPGGGPDGRGRPETYPWPERAREVPPARLRDEHVDVVVAQRPHELELAQRWLGRRPGRDVPAVYVEHNTPKNGPVPLERHPLADRSDILLVHVTHFNKLFWDNGQAPTTVIEHGVVDPGYRFTGELPHAGVVVNEPVRRGRVTGTDLLPELSRAAPLEVFGIGVTGLSRQLGAAALRPRGDLPQARLHAELARCRAYLHPYRWTSLGLSLIEAMHLGLPVVALATTEVVTAVPLEAGVISTRLDTLAAAVRSFVADPLYARQVGKAARAAALDRYSLSRFHRDWDRILTEVTR